MTWWLWILIVLGGLLVIVLIHDLTQRRHAILRNFPVIGHLRFILEAFGPELRQYIVADNDAERPFSRDERRWVYSSAKKEDTHFGFGTDNNLDRTPDLLVIRQSPFPLFDPHAERASDLCELPSAKVLGQARGRAKAFRPRSLVNVSSMSYGSLGARAIQALNQGAALAGAWQGTGEGGLSPHHLHGGDLCWQIGTGYFGCRDATGAFDLARFHDVIATNPTITMIEIKLSQGAKPGLGGLLPGPKVTKEIATIRGVEPGVDCWSPTRHTAFHDVDSLLDFVETLAEASGLPVGIKSAVGQLAFFDELAQAMVDGQRGVDFITIDGGEGGTGAAPLFFADHVSLPFKVGFAGAYRCFAQRGLTDRVLFIGSGRLGLPENAILALALGCDTINVAREAMLALGCIQAQRCQTGRCPTGVATNSHWRQRGLDPASKSVRVANYLDQLRRELDQLSRACGVSHPALVGLEHLAFVDDHFVTTEAREVFSYEEGWGVPSPTIIAELRAWSEASGREA